MILGESLNIKNGVTMKTYVLYRPDTEHERVVIDFEHDFTNRTQNKLEMISLDPREGAHMAETYDVVQYPAVIAVDDQGRLLKLWQGDMPLINELSYFTHD